jgi:glycerol-1-phosphate dehydrogenase [NAD(P)+]
VHKTSLDAYTVGKGAVNELASYIKKYGAKKAFLFADVNTYPVAGDKICAILSENGIAYSKYVFNEKHLEPDEKAVGSAVMHYDTTCDIIVCLGSGVLNDISKIVSKMTGKPYIIVATAPSMDGYASASSSMSMDGVKVSLNSKCPNVVIGDIDILKTAPVHMSKSGLGDMLAKYVSICEWRIAHIVKNEYYCEQVASMMRTALKNCVAVADRLLTRDKEAVKAVFEGLVMAGIAVNYAGLSRPASGVEHYISHIWDMRSHEFGTPEDLHGIQCAVGTLIAVKLYEKLKMITPDRKKALASASAFDWEAYCEDLRAFLGRSAESMIAQEAKEQKYNLEKHAARLEIILENWDAILKIMEEELPAAADLEKAMKNIEIPATMAEIGQDPAIFAKTFISTKDIRDKYVLSRLAWDLGEMETLISGMEV